MEPPVRPNSKMAQITPHALSIGKATPFIALARSLAKNKMVFATSMAVMEGFLLCNA
jgi:hypothetical protein